MIEVIILFVFVIAGVCIYYYKLPDDELDEKDIRETEPRHHMPALPDKGEGTYKKSRQESRYQRCKSNWCVAYRWSFCSGDRTIPEGPFNRGSLLQM